VSLYQKPARRSLLILQSLMRFTCLLQSLNGLTRLNFLPGRYPSYYPYKKESGYYRWDSR